MIRLHTGIQTGLQLALYKIMFCGVTDYSPKCKNHIGWAFTPVISPMGSDPTFYALIHEKLYYELDGFVETAISE